jgi:glycosyltransferase involved in cell wall biosynthesis
LRYARGYCQRRYFADESLPPDEPVEFCRGDLFLGLDLAAHLVPQNIGMFRRMRNKGVTQYFVVYDLLPLLRPDCFDPPGLPLFRKWYESIAEVSDGVVCISHAVADEFRSWLDQARPERLRPLNIGWFHLGADLVPDSTATLEDMARKDELFPLGDRPTFLMVGTVEPRKGHAQALAACERLWQQGVNVNLLVVGKPGWLVEELLRCMATHPERGQRLFWFENADDDLLLAAYRRADALLMASEGEGFGLPLIEGAHHGLPLIARDLPVFREIAGHHAHYFSGYGGEELAESLKAWLTLHAAGLVPASAGMRWNTWKQATSQLVDVILRGEWVHHWKPGPLRRYHAFDYRLRTEVGRLVRGRVEATGKEGVLVRGPGIHLEAGRYTVRIRGGGRGAGTVDVVAAAGTRSCAHGRFVAAGGDEDPGLLMDVDLQLDADVADMEIRIEVAAGADMWLADIEIVPIGTTAHCIAA